ncbi:histidine phosphatase family protein [Sporosalibacterium faouarense]|uniref:histidine phosphatase family protein n=1 Tax=Sporosalibacterium faouarense TaxID=516123 RepID=UPI00192AB7BA|nr:histidine phosphatase family protein [Sporosalibacterium faouarense]
MTNIYLVRHAHSVYTQDELNRPLSEIGKKDAQRVTEILSRKNIDYILSSPYKRSIETVEGLASYLDKEITIVDDFRERKLAERSVNDFEKVITKVWEDYSFSWDGGESNYIAQRRGINALRKVLEQYNEKNIVIGTHGNIMVLIMNYFDKSFDFLFWKDLEMPDIYKLTFENERLVNTVQIWR